jgi:S-adenosylmethionine:tRNA ribosyltransferase-isomerase
VIPARLLGERSDTGGKMEFVLLKRLQGDDWEVLVKPGRRALPGRKFSFGSGLLKADVLGIAKDGNRVVRFIYDGIFEEVLDKVGIVPLPPYITEKPDDMERYQTVYSRNKGSAAAPTAGLHFTEELLTKIRKMGVSIAKVTLHVGLGTFRPVKAEIITDHIMHSEYYEIDGKTADLINKAKLGGGRIISVGTTSTRVVESVANEHGFLKEAAGETDIFIYPGYKFKAIDALITNFHLPESTLLMLVSALAGRDNIIKAYKEAVSLKYRFFSFGDAMFIK